MGLVRGNLISNRLESKGCRGVVCGDFGVGLPSQSNKGLWLHGGNAKVDAIITVAAK